MHRHYEHNLLLLYPPYPYRIESPKRIAGSGPTTHSEGWPVKESFAPGDSQCPL